MIYLVSFASLSSTASLLGSCTLAGWSASSLTVTISGLGSFSPPGGIASPLSGSSAGFSGIDGCIPGIDSGGDWIKTPWTATTGTPFDICTHETTGLICCKYFQYD